ncbi:MmgE/PrpD family protein [Acuticoccus mangrovi]|uniref:MmgE/PrpD family protein n=1 Tax=Acuticoccus mangrovi TaxID=2796142 RepID=A0A934IJX6_9HYPH|nr:MmgE/PrpD family protein [Acuticoccus mangrovi]MBJ3777858.1 MmgE/PrpD family protein [Acuticoccus mangrovi]
MAAAPPPAILARIGGWAAALAPGDIPEPVRHVARRAIIDTIGVMIAGADTAVGRLAAVEARATYAPGPARLAAGGALAGPGAAFANATAAHALDFDDNCYAGVVHGSAAVLPAALASVQEAGGDGAALLLAFVAGSEVEYAIGEVLGDAIYARGWWTSALFGTAGAAAAAGRAMGLVPGAMAAALGTALAGAGGVKAAFGSDAKPLLLGRASAAGLGAARLAAMGASGPDAALEAAAGLAALLGVTPAAERAGGPAECGWRLLTPGLDVKRVPVCLSAHAAIDALEDLCRETRVAGEAIAAIEVDAPALVWRNLGHPRPRTAREAQFSMPFVLAMTALGRPLTVAALDEAVAPDAPLAALMERVSARSSPEWDAPARRAAAPEGAALRVRLRDGRVLEAARDRPRGGADDPLSDAELDAKFLTCVAPSLGVDAAAALLARLRRLEAIADLSDLPRPAAAASAAPKETSS